MSFIPISKADMDALEKEKKSIERRRKEERERMQYFFNEKKRSFGVDVDFIQTQIDDKKAKKLSEIENDKQHRAQIDDMVEKLDKLNLERDALHRAKQYHVGQAQKNTKREMADTFDLNDPLRIRNDKPPRMNDTDSLPSCSMQKFDGEDLNMNDRISKQKSEMRKWCKELISEKKNISESEKEEIMKYLIERNSYLNEMDRIENENISNKKQDTILCSKDNVISMKMRKEREANNAILENRESVSEIENMLSSEFLNEKWDKTKRCDGTERFIPYAFKGFSNEQKQIILNEQSAQIVNLQKQKDVQKQREQEWDIEQKLIQREQLLQLRNVQKMKLEKRKNLENIHKTQMNETKEKFKNINQIYQNKVTDDYFKQFQNSTR